MSGCSRACDVIDSLQSDRFAADPGDPGRPPKLANFVQTKKEIAEEALINKSIPAKWPLGDVHGDGRARQMVRHPPPAPNTVARSVADQSTLNLPRSMADYEVVQHGKVAAHVDLDILREVRISEERAEATEVASICSGGSGGSERLEGHPLAVRAGHAVKPDDPANRLGARKGRNFAHCLGGGILAPRKSISAHLPACNGSPGGGGCGR